MNNTLNDSQPASYAAMKTLTEQYYNAIVTQLQLNNQQFQLAQGNIAVGATSQTIWAMMDAIPPKSVVNNWAPGGINTFSSQYGALITRTQDTSTGAFQAALGDYYSAWQAYLKANPPTVTNPIISVYTSWAYSCGMPPDQANKTVGLFQAALNGPVTQANIAWAVAGGQTAIKAYNQTVETIDNTIAGAPSGSVTLNSQTESSDTSHSWAEGGIEGFFDIFFGGGESSYDSVSSQVLASELDLQMSFAHVSTVPVTPLANGTVTAGPTTYQPWYVPAALLLAYSNNNNNTWQIGTPDWTTFFGPQATLPRVISALVVVDGISITVTSGKSIDQSSRAQVQSAFEAGFFPFFGVAGSGGWETTTSFSDEGIMTVTSTCPQGNPQVLGILQSPISSYVSDSALRAAMRETRAVPLMHQAGGTRAEVRAKEGARAVAVVQVNWTAAAIAGLNASIPNPGQRQLTAGFVDTWVQNSAPGWVMGAQYQWHAVGRTATAELVATAGGDRIARVVAFV
uniref:Uncharacterized protein n=1 Tax=Caldilinea aerophila TaxID=133453 RepID=A0A7C1JDA0_9CHLR